MIPTNAMRGLAEYVMRGHKQAIMMVLLFRMIPLFGWLSDVIVGLVCLRKGAKAGSVVLLWAILPSIVLAIIGYSQFWVYSILGGSLTVFLLALVLRNTASWTNVLYVTVFLGIVGVIAVHLYNPDIVDVWSKELNTNLQMLKEQRGITFDLSEQDRQSIILTVAKLGTGIKTVILLSIDLLLLLFARWCQALLFNPGKLRPELQDVRLHLSMVGVLALFLFGSMNGVAVAIDSMPVILLLFVLAGLSLFHYAVAVVKLSKIWVVGFYCLWIILFSYLTLLLIGIALMDSWLDIRKRLKLRNV